MRRVEQRTTLERDAASAWAAAVSAAGINHELRPLLRMTVPAGLRGKTIDDVEVGIPLGRSWILLAGVVPVDFDDLVLAELEPGRRFLERSQTAAFRVWEHERTIEPAGGEACVLTDRLGFELRRGLARVPGVERFAAAIVGFLFRHRHRRVAKGF